MGFPRCQKTKHFSQLITADREINPRRPRERSASPRPAVPHRHGDARDCRTKPQTQAYGPAAVGPALLLRSAERSSPPSTRVWPLATVAVQLNRRTSSSGMPLGGWGPPKGTGTGRYGHTDPAVSLGTRLDLQGHPHRYRLDRPLAAGPLRPVRPPNRSWTSTRKKGARHALRLRNARTARQGPRCNVDKGRRA